MVDTDAALPLPPHATSAAPAATDHAHGHGREVSILAHHFDDLEQQKEAATLGMWAFLATEVMFFGGALTAYAVYRNFYPEAFAAASNLENLWVGAFNTCVLLVSSFTVVLAVHAAQHGDNKGVARYMWLTILFGLAFLGVKAYEYSHLFHEGLVPGPNFDPHGLLPEHLRRPGQLFFGFYFALTAIHALHMIIGIGIVYWVIRLANRGRFTHEYYNPVEITGLYWHFVDIVWIFLYPLLYLIDPLAKAGGGH